jgi:nitroimidazol reductase NimA-like FMN-containing flavoprotein (pyridoxamine 5'-phosphate oxidase superfamily)
MTNDQNVPVAPTDHTGLQVLTLEDCLRHLRQSPVGRVAFPLDGEISVLPVNHSVDGTDICFRTLGDSKIQAAVDHERVAFEVDSYDEATRDGWSVLVQGTAVIVTDPEDVRRLEGLARKPWVPGEPSAMTWIRVRSQAITGRAIVRS